MASKADDFESTEESCCFIHGKLKIGAALEAVVVVDVAQDATVAELESPKTSLFETIEDSEDSVDVLGWMGSVGCSTTDQG